MNPVSRGFRNAFRNGVRTASIAVILGLSIGLSLTMLVAQRAVDNKIKNVKSSIGNTITISPAGYTAGSSANNALTTSQLSKIGTLPNITNVTETLSDRLSTTGSSSMSFGPFGGGSSNSNGSTTSLSSPITLNFKGGGHFFIGGGQGIGGNSSLPTTFSLPVSFIGTNDPTSVNGTSITVLKGKYISGTTGSNVALISSQMASKNNLSVGSAFSAYNTSITVTGIFTAISDQSAQNTVVLSLPTLQRLSGQSGDITSAVATVNSLDNLSSAATAVKNQLGSNADVESAQQQADSTVAPLNSVKSVATFSLVGAVGAGAVIILLTMIMVVRERKKEIGVVKAIGGSNLRIMSEFMVESLTLAVLGSVVGLFIGVVGGQPVTKMLVNNSTTSTTTTVQPGGPMAGGGGFAAVRSGSGGFGGGFNGGFRRNGAVRGLSNIKTQIGWGILLDGFGAAVLIAVIGSALSAGMIAKVRPSTIMRAE